MESETFEKYKNFRNMLVDIERSLERHKTELENIDMMKKVQRKIDILDEKIRNAIQAMDEQISQGNDLYRSIRIDFHNFAFQILHQNAMFAITQNTNHNIDFRDTINDSKDETTAQSLGHSYKKILCACFDLAVIKNYIDKSFYRVIYHDGCLESLDPRKIKQYLDLFRSVSEEYDIQYILTALNSDIPEEEQYHMQPGEIAVNLWDSDDDHGRLFGFSF